ncbi:MAG: hypothetical protein EON47_08135 [Acetobacteraceae bacterium]|nr:MAG: hypothetical protein EON47_08135 [Acetobacteraceae bacterium]
MSIAAMPPQQAATDPGQAARPVVLRVSGGKPLRLTAMLLAEGTSWSPRIPAWHEVSLFAGPGGEIALGISTFKKSAHEADVHRAELFPDLDAALGALEGFDPTADLAARIDAADPRISGAVVALQAAALRQQADGLARQWRGMLGELLYQLCQPE